MRLFPTSIDENEVQVHVLFVRLRSLTAYHKDTSMQSGVDSERDLSIICAKYSSCLLEVETFDQTDLLRARSA